MGEMTFDLQLFSIDNKTANTLVSGTNDDDTIYNHGEKVSIQALGGNDFIENRAGFVTINAGDGDDRVWNNSQEMQIDGGAGDDSIYVIYFYGNTINGGAGNDTLINEQCANVSISGGIGNDYIINNGSEIDTIDGGAGNDTLEGTGREIIIFGTGDGKDVITNYRGQNLISLTSGKVNNTLLSGTDIILGLNKSDSLTLKNAKDRPVRIKNADASEMIINAEKIGQSVSAEQGDTVLNGSSGEDTISNWNYDNVTIDAGASDDDIRNEGANSSIEAGNGDDTVKNYGNGATINADAGNDTILSNGSDSTIDAGAGNDSIQNDGDNVTISCGDDDDFIVSFGSNSSISGGDGNDSITNRAEGAGSTLDGGAGDDSINNWAGEVWNETTQKYDITPSPDNAIMLGGSGKDTLYNEGSAVSMDGGADNDFLLNGGYFESERAGQNVTLDGGEGNDSIISHGNNSLLDGGAGDDSIFNGYRYYRPWEAFYDPDDEDYTGDNATILGGAGNDYIKNRASSVTIGGGAGDDSISLTSDAQNNLIEYSSGDGNDTIWGFNDSSTLEIGGGNGSYSTVINGNDLIVTVGEGKISLVGAASLESVTLLGVNKTSATLTVNDSTPSPVVVGSVVKVIDAAKRTKAVKITGNELTNTITGGKASDTLDGGAGNDVFFGELGNDCLNGGDGNDTLSGGAGADTLLGGAGKDSLAGGEGNDKLEGGTDDDNLFGEAGNDVLNGDEGNDSLSGDAGNDKLDGGAGKDYLTGGDGADTLLGGEGNDTLIGGTGNDYLSGGAGSNIFIYNDGDGNDVISDFNATSQLRINKAFSTVKSNSDIIVTVGTGKITLSGATTLSAVDIKDMTAPFTKIWRLNGTTATYGTSKKTDVTVKGVKSLDGLSISGKVVTISKESLGTSKVTINSGYTLKLAKDVTAPQKKAAAWTYNSGVATYKSASNTAGYTLASNAKSITYTKAKDATTLIQIKGVKSKSGLKLSNKVVTIAATALNKKDVTVTKGDGYTLKLAKGVAAPTTKAAAWAYKDSVATYKQTTTAGYTLASNGKSISYTKAKTAATLATINGVNSKEGLKVSGKVITVPNAIVGSKKKVTVSGNYEFNFSTGSISITGSKVADSITSNAAKVSLNGGKGNDMISLGSSAKNNVIVYAAGDGFDTVTNYSADDTIKITAATATATTSGTDVIFTVGKGSILLKDAKSKTISYVDSDGAHTYSAFGTDVSISGNTIKLLEDYTDNSFNVADYGAKLQNIDASAVQLDIEIAGNALMNSIKGGNGNDTLTGGGSNDTLTGGDGSDVFIWNKGDGNDLITDYTEDDTINIASGKVSTIKTSGKDVIFTVDKGKITLEGAADKTVSYVEGGATKFYGDGTSDDVIVNGTTVTLTENYTAESFDLSGYAKTIKTVNAAAVTRDLSITANDNANSVLGGSGNDTLRGGKGNDSLTGGKGSDVFAYSSGDGNDVITDYSEEDKIKIATGTAKINKSGKNVIFTVGNGKITVAGAASKTITYIDASGKTNYFPTTPADSIIWKDSNKTAILRETYSKTTFTASDHNASIKTIDASSVTHNIKITGNGKANLIMGGYEDDTLNGGKGNDTLQGGSGADVFLYASGDGNDRIVDYAEEDTIKITKGTAKVSTSGSDVIFTIGSGKITLAGATNKTVSYIEGGKTKTYGGSASNVLEDDNFIKGNDLSALVQSKAIDCSLAEIETPLTSAKDLIKLAHSGKK